MIARRILAAVILLWAFPCLAQTGSIKTPSQLNSEINTIFPDNSVGQITPAGLRQVTLDQVASVPFLNIINVFTASQSFPNGVVITGGTITGATVTGGVVTGLPTPVNPSDAVTLSYVNAAVSTGINILAPSRLATAAILPNTPTYSNGTLGVGATLTSGSNSTLTVDGTVANLNDIVLVKNQGSAFQNGIYSLTTAGSGAAAWVLTRVSYFDQAAEMKVGSYTFVTAGTANANAAYTLQSTVTTVGTDALTWALFSSTGTAVTSLDGTNGNITVATGSLKVVSGQLSSNVLSSRAFAQTQNLSSFSSIQTQGYATAGDGGGATFRKLGAGVPFQDTYMTGATLVGGSGYTNGTYLGVLLGGGTGVGCEGSAVVSGGAVASLTITVPCTAYKVGDVLTIPNAFLGGSGSGMTYTVTSVSTAQASFTDSASNNWQFVINNGPANINQFGGKGDWAGSDAGATNNSPALWSANAWAALVNGAAAAQVTGNQIVWPRGAYMTCGQVNFSTGNTGFYFPISQGVRHSGTGIGGTTLVECATDSGGVHYIELCDVQAKSGQYGCKIEDMTINLNQVTGSTSNVAAIYSEAGQQFPLAERLEIQPFNRVCISYARGAGGAANAIFNSIDCEQQSTTTNDGMRFNASGTAIIVRDAVFGAGGGTATHNAINLVAGRLVFDCCEIEESTTGVLIASTASQDVSVIKNISVTNGCVSGVTLTNTNPNNTVIIENIYGGSCSGQLVTNGHSGGSSVAAGSIVAQRVFNP